MLCMLKQIPKRLDIANELTLAIANRATAKTRNSCLSTPQKSQKSDKHKDSVEDPISKGINTS
jgi:hypothetical protein